MSLKINLNNRTFGQLKVLKECIYPKVTCKCSCGIIKNIDRAALLSGATVSCGCKKRARTNYKKLIEIQGKKIGKITPIDISHINENGDTYWNCLCDCGKLVKIRRDGLINAIKQNLNRGCGCERGKLASQLLKNKFGANNQSWRGYGEISKSFMTRTKSGARFRNLEFSITIEEIWDLFLKQNRRCALSGLELKFGRSDIDRKNCTASLDRIDSSKGYTIDNVQWVHKNINKMKMDLEQEEFLKFCMYIVDYQRLA